uniref:TFIIA-alpha and beta-like factor n=1 Tax=Laticauda laticaudata TaxID=8630 RepID=A0A8C5SK72_LATLA
YLKLQPPKFYKSVIDDVIEGVQDVFLEEGVDEQILKELKRRWEMKVMQSKATEGFFHHNHVLPQFTLHLPSSFQSSQSSGAILSLPSGLTYPIQIPPGVTLQTTSGHLYKVNMPVVVTQTTDGGTAIQTPLEQIFQQVGKQSLVPQPSPVNIIQANMSSVQETSNGSLLTSKLPVPQHLKMGHKDLLGATAATLEATRSQGEVRTLLDTSVQMESDLLAQKNTSNDLEEILQLDGTSDLSPKAETESPRDGEDEELVGIIDAEDLKVLDEEEEEEGENSTSDNQSLNSTSDADESSVDIVEEVKLNVYNDLISLLHPPDIFDYNFQGPLIDHISWAIMHVGVQLLPFLCSTRALVSHIICVKLFITI